MAMAPAHCQARVRIYFHPYHTRILQGYRHHRLRPCSGHQSHYCLQGNKESREVCRAESRLVDFLVLRHITLSVNRSIAFNIHNFIKVLLMQCPCACVGRRTEMRTMPRTERCYLPRLATQKPRSLKSTPQECSPATNKLPAIANLIPPT